MMQTKTFTRLAGKATEAEAIQALLDRNKGASIVSFSTLDHPTQGKVYSAVLKLAEFPFKNDKDDEDKDAADDAAPKIDLDVNAGDEPAEDKSEDKPKEKSEGDKGKLDKLESLVEQIAQHLGIPTDGGEEDPLSDGEDPLAPDPMALPDSGAPAPGDVPLPPPIPEKPKGGPAGMSFASTHPHFAKVAKRPQFMVERIDAGEINNADMMREAMAEFPGFRVAKLDRLAKADENVAVVAMVAMARKTA